MPGFPEGTGGTETRRSGVPGLHSPPGVSGSERQLGSVRKGGRDHTERPAGDTEKVEQEAGGAGRVTRTPSPGEADGTGKQAEGARPFCQGPNAHAPPAPHLLRARADTLSVRVAAAAPPPRPGLALPPCPRLPRRPPAPARGPARSSHRPAVSPRAAEATRRRRAAIAGRITTGGNAGRTAAATRGRLQDWGRADAAPAWRPGSRRGPAQCTAKASRAFRLTYKSRGPRVRPRLQGVVIEAGLRALLFYLLTRFCIDDLAALLPSGVAKQEQ